MTKGSVWALLAACASAACLSVDDLPVSKLDASVDAGKDGGSDAAPELDAGATPQIDAGADPRPTEDADPVAPDAAAVHCKDDEACGGGALCGPAGTCIPRCVGDLCVVTSSSRGFCGLEARGDALYWALCASRDAAGNDRHDGELWRKKTGETPTLLASGLSTTRTGANQNYAFALGDTHAYYARRDQMLRVPLSGKNEEEPLYTLPATTGCRVWALGSDFLVFAMGDALWQGGLAPGQPPQRIREGAFCVHYWAPLWVDHDEIYFADYVSTRGSFDVFTTLRHFRSATPDVVVETPVVVGDSDTTVGFAPPYVYQLSNSSLAQADLRDGALGGLASPPSNDSFLQSAAISGAWAYWTETHRRGTDSYLTLRRAALAEADLTQPLVDLDDGVPRIAVLRDRVYVTTGPESAEVLYELLLPPAPCSHLQPCADGQTCSADALCHP